MGCGVLQEPQGVMGVVAVDKEEAMTAGGLFGCLLIKDFDPFNTYLPVRPSLLGVTNTSFKVSFI